METVQSAGRETQLIDLQLVRLGADDRFTSTHEAERCAIVLGGVVEASVAGAPLGPVGERDDVFDGPGGAIYAPPGAELDLEASSAATVAVAAAPLEGRAAGRARVIRAQNQRVAEAGTDNWRRTIRTILGPGNDAGRLVLGETINSPGNWSSYPPHKHDRQAQPEEVALEEVYFYRLRPEGGFAVQVLYSDREERAVVVHDGDAVAACAHALPLPHTRARAREGTGEGEPALNPSPPACPDSGLFRHAARPETRRAPRLRREHRVY